MSLESSKGKLNVKMTGLSKEDVVEMWKKKLWSRRAKATTVTVPKLCTYPPAEAIFAAASGVEASLR